MSELRVVAEREVAFETEQRIDAARTVEARAEAAQAKAEAAQEKANDMLMVALSNLSKRFVVALSALFTLATASAALLIWYVVIQDPTHERLIGATACSIFVLLLNRYGRRE